MYISVLKPPRMLGNLLILPIRDRSFRTLTVDEVIHLTRELEVLEPLFAMASPVASSNTSEHRSFDGGAGSGVGKKLVGASRAALNALHLTRSPHVSVNSSSSIYFAVAYTRCLLYLRKGSLE